jgi:hypothetical protein
MYRYIYVCVCVCMCILVAGPGAGVGGIVWDISMYAWICICVYRSGTWVSQKARMKTL